MELKTEAASIFWKVVGGGDKGGILVRAEQDVKSIEERERLSTGALIEERQLAGDRLHYVLRSGAGPSCGWVSTKLKDKALLVKIESDPIDAGNADSAKDLAEPQCAQVPGEPFVFYHQVTFLDSKPTGVRMSACFCIMDETRCDVNACCDQSQKRMSQVTDPHVEVALELCPAIQRVGKDAVAGGLLLTMPWIRSEGKWAWPKFPLKVEEENLFSVGKNKSSTQRVPIATGRFRKAFVDEATGGMCEEEKFAKDVEKFYSELKENHSSDHLNVSQLNLLYPSRGQPFVPTIFKKVAWKMTYSFCDCWSRFYHAKVPELLWEVNTEAGGPFAKLVEEEADPQAVVMKLDKQMELGTTYDVLCYLDEATRKANYLFLPAGVQDKLKVVLAVCALYDWESAPEDGRSLSSEDISITDTKGRLPLYKYAVGQETKATPLVDLAKLPSPGL